MRLFVLCKVARHLRLAPSGPSSCAGSGASRKGILTNAHPRHSGDMETRLIACIVAFDQFLQSRLSCHYHDLLKPRHSPLSRPLDDTFLPIGATHASLHPPAFP